MLGQSAGNHKIPVLFIAKISSQDWRLHRRLFSDIELPVYQDFDFLGDRAQYLKNIFKDSLPI